MGILWAIVSAVFTGLIVGALARLIIPGTKGISIGMTIVIGIGGAIVGSLIYGAFGGTDTSGIDWIRLGYPGHRGGGVRAGLPGHRRQAEDLLALPPAPPAPQPRRAWITRAPLRAQTRERHARGG